MENPVTTSVSPVAPSATPEHLLVESLLKLLAQKGPGAVKEIQRRIDTGQGLTVKGKLIDTKTLQLVLARHVQSNAAGVQPAEATSCSSSVARWAPQEAPKALAQKALLECDTAEPFCTIIKVTGDNKVAVLPKPNILSQTTGEYLLPGESVEVIARCLTPRDGRVHLRLKKYSGWVSTRSRKDFAKVVLTNVKNEAPLEPSQSATEPSRALHLLQRLDANGHPAVSPQADTAPSGSGCESQRFRALGSGRLCPLLANPNLDDALGASLQAKEEFVANGIFLNAADGRTYLHLEDGRGWVSERSKTDFGRFAVEPASFLRHHVLGAERQKRVIIHQQNIDARFDNGVECKLAEAKFTKPARTSAPVAVAFRSDNQLWPPELHPPRPIKSGTRVKLRQIYGAFFQQIQECEQDIREATERVDTYAKACPAQRELRQLIEALNKDLAELQNKWAQAVLQVLPTDDAGADGDLNASTKDDIGIAQPVQVNGHRYYCALLRTVQEDVVDRHIGPLRLSDREAGEDLHQMQRHLGMDKCSAPTKRRRLSADGGA